MKDNHYCVYLHMHKDSYKVYVGMTSNNPLRRWCNGRGYKGGRFQKAIDKYGWDSFEHIIMSQNLTYEEACQIEKDLIKFYNSQDSDNGYNIESRGRCNKNYSKKSLDNMRIAQMKNAKKVICRNNNFVYDSLSQASKLNNTTSGNIVKCCKGERRYAGKDENGVGLIWGYYDENNKYDLLSSDTINHILTKRKSKVDSRSVICLNNKQIFNSVVEAEKFYNIHNVVKSCQGIYSYAGIIDGQKLQWMFYDDWINANKPINKEIKINSTYTKVRCINDGAIYNTIKDATKFYNIKNYQNIVANCRGVTKSVGNIYGDRFSFEYVKEGE